MKMMMSRTVFVFSATLLYDVLFRKAIKIKIIKLQLELRSK